MSDQKLPSGGGSYLRDAKGALKQVVRPPVQETRPAAPAKPEKEA